MAEALLFYGRTAGEVCRGEGHDHTMQYERKRREEHGKCDV